MGHDVFISHAATDKIIAGEITSSLEKGGVRCWVAPRDIRPGDTWGGSIVKAIENCSIMVIVFSTNSNKSRQVLREVERAIQKNVVALPFRIDEQEPTGDMEYFLSATHWLDALNGDMETHYQHLLQTTLSILEREALENQPQVIPTPDPEPAPEPRVARRAKAEPTFDESPEKIEFQELERPSEMELAKQLDEAIEESQDSPAESDSKVVTNAEADIPKPPTKPHSPIPNTPAEPSNIGAEVLPADFEAPQSKASAAPDTNTEFDDYSGTPTDRDPRLAPELMIDRGQKRRNDHEPKAMATAPKKWMLMAAGIIPVIAVGAWFFINSNQPSSNSAEPIAAIKDVSKTEQPPSEISKSKATNKETTKKAASTKKNTANKSSVSKKSVDKNTNKATKKKPTTVAKKNTPNKSTPKVKAETPIQDKKVAPTLSQAELDEIARKKAAADEAKRLAAKRAAAEKAFSELVAKAEAGDVNSQMSLAQKYQDGDGVKQSNQIANTWLARAAEAGNSDAQFALSLTLMRSNQSEASVSWLIKAAEQGNIAAQTKLAESYSSGSGVAQNDRLAIQWYQRAAELGDIEAQKNLATLFEFGIGTNKDLRAALKWYRAAAAQGDMSSRLYVEKLLEKAPALNQQTDSANIQSSTSLNTSAQTQSTVSGSNGSNTETIETPSI